MKCLSASNHVLGTDNGGTNTPLSHAPKLSLRYRFSLSVDGDRVVRVILVRREQDAFRSAVLSLGQLSGAVSDQPFSIDGSGAQRDNGAIPSNGSLGSKP